MNGEIQRLTSGLHVRAIVAFLVVLASAVSASTAIAAPNYPFSSASGVALEDMSSGTAQLLGPDLDDAASALANIGFEFLYADVVFTQFGVNSNGLVRLGAVPTTSFDNGSATTGFATTTNSPKIAPYYDDLRVGTNGKVHFKVVGAAPNRKLVIEWLNMQIPLVAAGNPGAGTFQLWLTETSGVIEFVYGSGMAVNSANGGYTIGLQSGAATSIASVTAAGPTVSYTTANNTQSSAIPSGTKFTFTPNLPLAPTGLTFTNVTAVSMTLNWTDNATNELGYFLYNSTDGVNFSRFAQTAANTVSQNLNGLTPGTTYFWRVVAFTEGAFSAPAAGSRATSAAGVISSTAAGGNWSNPGTWSGGVVPTSSDNVTIFNGAIVTIDTAALAYNLTVGQGGSGFLQWDSTTARSLTAGSSVSIAPNANFVTQQSGTVQTHVLSVGGSLTNNGVIDFSTNNNTAGAGITFTGAVDASCTLAAGSTTRFKQTAGVTLNKGTSSAPVLTFTPGGAVTVLGANAVGFLTINSGTFKLSGSNFFSNPVFNTADYDIPTTGGFWMNNPNATVAGQNSAAILRGLFRMSQGTFNIGTASGNSLGLAGGSDINVEGGNIKATGRFGVSSSTNSITYNQTGGTITVCTIGNASTTLASFDLGTGSDGAANISGGTIVCQLANTALSNPRDYRHQQGAVGLTAVTGGTLQLGNAASGAAKAFNIAGVFPNLVLNNQSAGHSATFLAPFSFNHSTLNVTTNTGTTLDIGNNLFVFNGTTFTNNGTLTANGASSKFVWFRKDAPVNYTGSGTVTSPMTNFQIETDLGLTIDPASPNIVVSAIRLLSGSLINSNKITLGNGGATSGTVQIGNTTTPTAAGSFDLPFTFNLGSAGQTISYLRTTAPRSTGPEINPTRTLTTLTYDDIDPTHSLTIAGGDITVTGITHLTNGRIVTGANNLIGGSAGSIARTTGHVHGNLRKTFTASATKTFEVGDAATYAPVTMLVGGSDLPSNVTVSTTGAQEPHYPGVLSGLRRYWTIGTSTNIIADLTFQYVSTDVVGLESDYHTVVYQMIDPTTSIFIDLGTVDAVNHRGVANGINNIRGNWTLLEADTDFDGLPSSYESAHGLQQNDPADASTDLDGDGATNLAEYLAGTDPQLASSVFRITAITRDLAGHALVTFNAIANKTYRLEFNTTLASTGWMALPISDLIAPSTGAQQLTDTTASGQPARFYRVRVVFP